MTQLLMPPIRARGLDGGVRGMRTDEEILLALRLGTDQIGADDPAAMRERILRILHDATPATVDSTTAQETR